MTNFNRMVSVLSVLKKECSGCGHIFMKEDLGGRVEVAKSGRLYCPNCQASIFDMEAWCEIVAGE